MVSSTVTSSHTSPVAIHDDIVYGFPEGSSDQDLATKAAMLKMGESTKDLIYNTFDQLSQRPENEQIYGLYSADNGRKFLIEHNAQYRTPTMGLNVSTTKGECTELALTVLRRLKRSKSLSNYKFSIVRGKSPKYFNSQGTGHYSVLAHLNEVTQRDSTIPSNAILIDPSFKTISTGSKATESGYTLDSFANDLANEDLASGLTGPGESGNQLENCWTIQKISFPSKLLLKGQILGYQRDIIPDHPIDRQDLLLLCFATTWPSAENLIQPFIGKIDSQGRHSNFELPETPNAEPLRLFLKKITKQANSSMPKFDSYLQRHPEMDLTNDMKNLPIATLYESSVQQ